MTIEQLQARCDYWIDRLDMGEWRGRCVVSFRSPKYLAKVAGESAGAGIWWQSEECKSEIYLGRKNADEPTLLHEILHLLLQGHTTFKVYDELTERAINRLAAAFLTEQRPALPDRPAPASTPSAAPDLPAQP